MKKIIGNYGGTDLYLTVSSYRNNGRIYLGLETEDEDYADITINLSEHLIQDDNYIYLSSDMSEDLEKFLIDYKIINEPYDITQYNMGKYKCTTVNFDILREYDEEGFKEFEKSINDSNV